MGDSICKGQIMSTYQYVGLYLNFLDPQDCGFEPANLYRVSLFHQAMIPLALSLGWRQLSAYNKEKSFLIETNHLQYIIPKKKSMREGIITTQEEYFIYKL